MAQQAARHLAGDDIPPEVRAWLARGLSRYLKGEPLDRALGLTDSDRKRERNAALCRAAQAMDPDHELGDWCRAGRLEQGLRRFEASTWPRVRHTDGASLGPYHRALFDVLQSGAPPVRSQRRIHDLLTRGY